MAYIADAGSKYDEENREYWLTLRHSLGDQRPIPEGALPHWSRFVLQTGTTRNGEGRIQWLRCR